MHKKGGRQKRVWIRSTIDRMPVDEFIARNADSVWLKQNDLSGLASCDSLEEARNGSAEDGDHTSVRLLAFFSHDAPATGLPDFS